MHRRGHLAEVATQFHGLTMNGGFIHSFSESSWPLNEVADAFDLLKLAPAARVISAAIDLVPGSGEDDVADRRKMVDGLPAAVAEALETLGGQYTDLVPDALLSERIALHASPRTRRPRLPRSVPEMLAEYETTLLDRAEAMKASHVAEANRLMGRNHDLYKHLRVSEEAAAGYGRFGSTAKWPFASR